MVESLAKFVYSYSVVETGILKLFFFEGIAKIPERLSQVHQRGGGTARCSHLQGYTRGR